MHAPLVKDASYPVGWPDIKAAGEECKGLDGTYTNIGVIAIGTAAQHGASLTQILGLSGNASEVSLLVKTRKIGNDGNAFSILVVVPQENPDAQRELSNCFCISQTLICGPIKQSSWAIPSLGFGASQSAVYMSSSTDGSLIVRLQDYHIDIILVMPIFGKTEPWARFLRSER